MPSEGYVVSDVPASFGDIAAQLSRAKPATTAPNTAKVMTGADVPLAAVGADPSVAASGGAVLAGSVVLPPVSPSKRLAKSCQKSSTGGSGWG